MGKYEDLICLAENDLEAVERIINYANDERTDYQIDFIWDDETGVWIATSKDIAGLVLESDSLGLLMERARDAASELLCSII